MSIACFLEDIYRFKKLKEKSWDESQLCSGGVFPFVRVVLLCRLIFSTHESLVREPKCRRQARKPRGWCSEKSWWIMAHDSRLVTQGSWLMAKNICFWRLAPQAWVLSRQRKVLGHEPWATILEPWSMSLEPWALRHAPWTMKHQ